jgi:hypothetical protein
MEEKEEKNIKEHKEVKKSTESKNFNLFIFEQIKRGVSPSQISKQFNLSLPRISYYLSSLIKQGFIKKIGYGTYEILKEFEQKEVKKSTAVAWDNCNKVLTSLKPDSVRGHAFQFKLELPKNLRNWDKREEIFKQINLKFRNLNVPANSQAIIFKGRKIHLTNKSIIIYEKESFISETAKESQSHAINHFIKLIKQLERHLQAKFSFGERYRFKVTRQHYALIKNALARQYDDEKKKLEVYNDSGLWFLIDNSFNLHEAETVHPISAVPDNEKVQNFFNGIKKFEGFTPEFVVNSLGGVMKTQEIFAQNIESHIKAIQDLSKGVNQLVKIGKQIKQENWRLKNKGQTILGDFI